MMFLAARARGQFVWQIADNTVHCTCIVFNRTNHAVLYKCVFFSSVYICKSIKLLYYYSTYVKLINTSLKIR